MAAHCVEDGGQHHLHTKLKIVLYMRVRLERCAATTDGPSLRPRGVSPVGAGRDRAAALAHLVRQYC